MIVEELTHQDGASHRNGSQRRFTDGRNAALQYPGNRATEHPGRICELRVASGNSPPINSCGAYFMAYRDNRVERFTLRRHLVVWILATMSLPTAAAHAGGESVRSRFSPEAKELLRMLSDDYTLSGKTVRGERVNHDRLRQLTRSKDLTVVAAAMLALFGDDLQRQMREERQGLQRLKQGDLSGDTETIFKQKVLPKLRERLEQLQGAVPGRRHTLR